MAGRRVVTLGLSAAAIGGGYYLYRAGGDPKVAEKQIEHDAARLSSSIRNELPGKGKELKTEGKLTAEEARRQIDSAYERSRAEGQKLESQIKEKATAWGNSAQQQADSAKSTLSQWGSDAQKKAEQARKDAEKAAADAKSSLSQYASDAEKKAEEARRQVGASLKGAVDSFDHNVEKGASQAKKGIWSWFGW